MKLKILFISLTMLVLIVIGYVVQRKAYFFNRENSSSNFLVNQKQADWLTYVNTKYDYAFKHPKNVYAQVLSEMDPSTVEETASLEINLYDNAPKVGIQITAWVPYTYQPTNKEALEYNRIAHLDLESFAEALRNKEADIKVDEYPDKRVGNLEEIIFAEHKAYAATITGYLDGYGSDTFRYIYVENGNYKLVIQYSLKGDLSKQIIDTFRFTK